MRILILNNFGIRYAICNYLTIFLFCELEIRIRMRLIADSKVKTLRVASCSCKHSSEPSYFLIYFPLPRIGYWIADINCTYFHFFIYLIIYLSSSSNSNDTILF